MTSPVNAIAATRPNTTRKPNSPRRPTRAPRTGAVASPMWVAMNSAHMPATASTGSIAVADAPLAESCAATIMLALAGTRQWARAVRVSADRRYFRAAAPSARSRMIRYDGAQTDLLGALQPGTFETFGNTLQE